jgi:hypothetical protein
MVMRHCCVLFVTENGVLQDMARVMLRDCQYDVSVGVNYLLVHEGL